MEVCTAAPGGRGPRQPQTPTHSLKIGDKFTAKVVRTTSFGAFLARDDGFEVLLPVTEMQTDGAMQPDPRDFVKENDELEVCSHFSVSVCDNRTPNHSYIFKDCRVVHCNL